MAPVEEPSAGGVDGGEAEAGGLGAGKSSYVPPHMRNGGAAGGEKMGGRFEKDDLATLRVTNVCFSALPYTRFYPCLLNVHSDNYLFHLQVSELAEEQELRDLFERFGRVTRVFLARDRETQRAKGFAFISYADRSDAVSASEKLDGCTCIHSTNDHMEEHGTNTLLLQSVTATLFSASSSPSELLRLVSRFSFTTYLVGFSFFFLQAGLAFG